MSLFITLREALEQEERETVGKSFGGTTNPSHTSFSIAKIRDQVISSLSVGNSTCRAETLLVELAHKLTSSVFKNAVGSAIRYSFLIELTNLSVGSTKMKTRWLPGLILMPEEGTFEPVKGSFQPGNDPRSSSFDECFKVFEHSLELLKAATDSSTSIVADLASLSSFRRIPYEFPLSYKNPHLVPVHQAANVSWVFTEDLRWLLKARPLLRLPASHEYSQALRKLEKAKIEVKVYKTDRCLTGKDKTNRAKRWEVLPGDFQHATLEQCWSAERKLTSELVRFAGFPDEVRKNFIEKELIPEDWVPTCCPVTLEPLSFSNLAASLLDPTHGRSQYQIGHLHPLKRGGSHDGTNVCWQSADGNRIQGDLSIEETIALLNLILKRRSEL